MTVDDREALDYLLEHMRARAELTTAQAAGRADNDVPWKLRADLDRRAVDALARMLHDNPATAWLIENHLDVEGKPTWLSWWRPGEVQWTTKIEDAVHFSRKQDAECVHRMAPPPGTYVVCRRVR